MFEKARGCQLVKPLWYYLLKLNICIYSNKANPLLAIYTQQKKKSTMLCLYNGILCRNEKEQITFPCNSMDKFYKVMICESSRLQFPTNYFYSIYVHFKPGKTNLW